MTHGRPRFLSNNNGTHTHPAKSGRPKYLHQTNGVVALLVRAYARIGDGNRLEDGMVRAEPSQCLRVGAGRTSSHGVYPYRRSNQIAPRPCFFGLFSGDITSLPSAYFSDKGAAISVGNRSSSPVRRSHQLGPRFNGYHTVSLIPALRS